MPIVTLKEILKDAQKDHYAVVMFDVWNLEMAAAVIEAAEQEASPVILAFAEVHADTPAKMKHLANIMRHYAMLAKVPVAVHLDHATSVSVINQAIEYGFSSVMYDASVLSFEENVRRTAQVVEMARQSGVSVEAELGHVGGEEGIEESDEQILYTNSDDAVRFVAQTGIDALAVSIGTVHGVYRKTPELQLPLLHQLRHKVAVPLVLHGGSGLSNQDFRDCIDGGIAKIKLFGSSGKFLINH